MRLIENPPNPFTSAHCEWLGPPPEVRVEVYEEHAKSILATNDSPDVGFNYSVNPYRGCQHACSYCYARPTHEYLGLGAGTDFDSKITVKINAPELLAKALSRPGWSRESIAFSGVTDCYQPLEAVYKLTEGCLRVCLDYCTPLFVITKSYLVIRDRDLLAEIHDRSRARVLFSIPFADDAVARQVETGAPTPSRRFEAMKRMHAAGVPVGVMVAPIIPGLNDRDVPAILEQAAAAGATVAGYVPLRLAGHVKDVFLSRLRERLPERAERVEARIRDMRGGKLNDSRFGERMRGTGEYWDSVRQLFEKSARRFGLNSKLDQPVESRPPAAPAVARPAVVQLPLF